MKTFWISFADDDGFRGVTIIEEEHEHAALTKSHIMHCNPGGEAVFLELVESFAEKIRHVPRNTLLSKEDLRNYNIPIERLKV